MPQAARRGPKKAGDRARTSVSMLKATLDLLKEIKEMYGLKSVGAAIDWAAPTIRRRLAGMRGKLTDPG